MYYSMNSFLLLLVYLLLLSKTLIGVLASNSKEDDTIKLLSSLRGSSSSSSSSQQQNQQQHQQEQHEQQQQQQLHYPLPGQLHKDTGRVLTKTGRHHHRRAREERRLEVHHDKFEGRNILEHQDGFHVLVTYKTPQGKDHALHNFNSHGPDFDDVSTVSGVVPSLDIMQTLLNDPDVASVAEDFLVYAAGETVPYGIGLSQFSRQPGERSGFSPNSVVDCSNTNAIKVGLVDAGMDIGHPDLPCIGSNCMGQSFGISSSWNSPTYFHGTHVAGTILGVQYNNQGIFGMAGGQDLCVIVARVLDDDGAAFMSRIMEGVVWAANQGATVINLSIAGGNYVQSMNAQLSDLYNNRGILIFAAAGNDGQAAYSYPASYDSVIAVGAVDETRNRAWFSNTNNKVDLVAPGNQILSTAPRGVGNVVSTVSGGSVTVTGKWMERSTYPNWNTVTATLVDCQLAQSARCPGPGGHICLIKNAGLSPERQARACQNGGGVAAVIFRGRPGRISGKLSVNTLVTIPVALLAAEDGPALLNTLNNSPVTLTAADGYMYSDGTSMSAPHASGAAVSLWRACRSCNHHNIESCLIQSATDLGEQGRDDVYGNGLINMQGAYNCLLNVCC